MKYALSMSGLVSDFSSGTGIVLNARHSALRVTEFRAEHRVDNAVTNTGEFMFNVAGLGEFVTLTDPVSTPPEYNRANVLSLEDPFSAVPFEAGYNLVATGDGVNPEAPTLSGDEYRIFWDLAQGLVWKNFDPGFYIPRGAVLFVQCAGNSSAALEMTVSMELETA